MLKAIQTNPYRIFGVYSNSTKKEQLANKGRMQAFLRVDRAIDFPLDLKSILPGVVRNQDIVDWADSELALPAGQIKHAQFWFINKTSIDGIAFNHLLSGRIDTAIEIWKKDLNMSSLHNLFICYLIKQDYRSAIVDCAIPLYDNYAESFVSTIDDKISISVSDLAKHIVDTLFDEGVDIMNVMESVYSDVWKTLINEKKINPILSQLESCVAEAKSTRGKNVTARLVAGRNLKKDSKELLEKLKLIIAEKNIRYQIIADKVALETLQCGIDYYNDTSDFDAPVKALPLCEYARMVAVGSAAKQRCKENYDIIKKSYDEMPSVKVAKEAKAIDNLFTWYRKQSRTSANGLELLKKARESLISIKEKLGKNHKYYLEISSILGYAALSYVIDEVNEAMKEDESDPLHGLFGGSKYRLYGNIFDEQERKRTKARTLKSVLASAWQTIVYIDLLDTTEDFKKNRYKENRSTLYSIISGLGGFDYPNDNYIIKGCAWNVSADETFFWCDSDYFSSCYSKSDYQRYLKKFPTGNHAEEAQERIDKFVKDRLAKVRYLLVAVSIILLIFVLRLMCSY